VLVLSILLYVSKTWTLLASNMKAIKSFHMKCQRRILGIRWNDFVRNSEISLSTVSHLCLTRLPEVAMPYWDMWQICQITFPHTKPCYAGLVHQSLVGLAPAYLTDDSHLLSDVGRRPLRSKSNDMWKLLVPRTHNKLGVSRPPVLDCGMTFHLDYGGRDLP